MVPSPFRQHRITPLGITRASLWLILFADWTIAREINFAGAETQPKGMLRGRILAQSTSTRTSPFFYQQKRLQRGLQQDGGADANNNGNPTFAPTVFLSEENTATTSTADSSTSTYVSTDNTDADGDEDIDGDNNDESEQVVTEFPTEFPTELPTESPTASEAIQNIPENDGDQGVFPPGNDVDDDNDGNDVDKDNAIDENIVESGDGSTTIAIDDNIEDDGDSAASNGNILVNENSDDKFNDDENVETLDEEKEENTPIPTDIPTGVPTENPTAMPTKVPTDVPSEIPTTTMPTSAPTEIPTTDMPTEVPTDSPIDTLHVNNIGHISKVVIREKKNAAWEHFVT